MCKALSGKLSCRCDRSCFLVVMNSRSDSNAFGHLVLWKDYHNSSSPIFIYSLTTPSTYSEEGGDGKGRTPTPKLRQQIEREGNFRRRHHLDRTTPSVGGAILSSPPQQKKRSGKKKFVSKSVDSISQGMCVTVFFFLYCLTVLLYYRKNSKYWDMYV